MLQQSGAIGIRLCASIRYCTFKSTKVNRESPLQLNTGVRLPPTPHDTAPMKLRPTIGRLVGGALVAVGLAASLLAALFVLVSAGWEASFAIENRSGETVWVTPVGVGEDGRTRSTLPLNYGFPPLLIAYDRGDFRLAPGEQRRFRYDWDDINFSEIAIRDAMGGWRHLVVRPGADTLGCCSLLRQREFTVPPLGTLPQASAAVSQAAVATRYNDRALVVWLLYSGPLFCILGMLLLTARRPTRDKRVSRRDGEGFSRPATAGEA